MGGVKGFLPCGLPLPADGHAGGDVGVLDLAGHSGDTEQEYGAS